MKILYTLAVALALPGVMGLISPCGDPDDPCMNNENWKQCRNLEVNGCKSIEVFESCPLQFACGDDHDKPLQEIVVIRPPPAEDIVGEKPDACVPRPQMQRTTDARP